MININKENYNIKFSVLMSVYKGENPLYLKEALKSVLNQTLLPSEIVIVIDGKLTPELDFVLKQVKSKNGELIKLLPFDNNRGLGRALHDGVLACNYDYIFRMDTDDIAEKDRFEKQINFLQDNKDISICGTWIKEFSKSPEMPDSTTKLPCSNEDIISFAKSRNPFRHMTVLLKKEDVIKAGNYRDFLWFEDYDLWVRMILSGCKTANLPEYLVKVRADSKMFARRGGVKYLKQDIKFQNFLYRSNFIGFSRFIMNILIRTLIRIVPNGMRIYFYENFLRKRVKN